MRWFVGRLTAAFAVVFVAMAVAVIATPGVSSAQCDPKMSWNEATGECKRPAAPPAWYVPPAPYAPSFAGQDVPPPPQWTGNPPPWPYWAPQAPMWSTGFHQWGIYVGGVWVPI